MSTPASPHVTYFLVAARWGVMCHYLGYDESQTDPRQRNAGYSAEHWNALVDAFDVRALARQLADVGAGYLLFTLGQGSGHFCAPNATYDAAVTQRPSKCSRRDLIADLLSALKPYNIPLLLYSTGDGPWGDMAARKDLGISQHWSDDCGWEKFPWDHSRNAPFQSFWESVHREWSLRWGSQIRGWWIDGCYRPDVRFPESDAPNLATFKSALRSGNPQAAITFNTGVHYPARPSSPHDDFVAGEFNLLGEVHGPWLQSGNTPIRNHVLTYLGSEWFKGAAPRFTDGLIAEYTRYAIARGAFVTYDVPMVKETGLLMDSYLPQLRQIGRVAGT